MRNHLKICGQQKSKKNNSTRRKFYAWELRNRLTTVTQQEWDSAEQNWQTVQIVEYTYDFNSVWIRKIVGNSKTIFIPENYQTTIQIDNNVVTHRYLWTPNAQDKLLADVTPTATLWSLTDHLGTIRDVLGATTTHLTYDAFGNLTSSTSPPSSPTRVNPSTPPRSSQTTSTAYAPTVGRWLSVDPIGFEGNDTNLYRYVGNVVLTYYDIKGLGEKFNKGGYMIEIHRADADTIIDPHGHIEQKKGNIQRGYKVDINTGKIFDSKNKPVIKGGYQLKLPKKIYKQLLEEVAKARKAGRLGCYITVIVFLPEVVEASEKGNVQ